MSRTPLRCLSLQMDRQDLIGDERYADSGVRLDRREEIEQMFTAWTMSKTKYEVWEALGREGVPCGATLDTADMTTNEHLKGRQMQELRAQGVI